MYDHRQCQPGPAGCQILACVCIALASMMSVTLLGFDFKGCRHSYARLSYTIASGEKVSLTVQGRWADHSNGPPARLAKADSEERGTPPHGCGISGRDSHVEIQGKKQQQLGCVACS